MVENILPADFLRPGPPPPPQTLGMGSVCENSFFSEFGHVSYQILENQQCTNTVAIILPTDPHPYYPPSPSLRPWGWVSRSKLNFFRTWSCYISNYRESRMHQNGSKYFARRAPTPHPFDPEDWVSRSKTTFSEPGYVAYQI